MLFYKPETYILPQPEKPKEVVPSPNDLSPARGASGDPARPPKHPFEVMRDRRIPSTVDKPKFIRDPLINVQFARSFIGR